MTRTFAAALAVLLLGATPALTQQNPAISDGIVRMGVILDMTGPYSANTGQGSVVAAHMAIEDFGKTVLGAPIELLVGDSENSTEHARTVSRDWFEKAHVDAIMDVAVYRPRR